MNSKPYLNILTISGLILGLSLSSNVIAEETTCPSGEEITCFADGACICVKRQIEQTDPVPNISDGEEDSD